MSTPIPVTPTQLPSGFCPAGYQEMLNVFSAHQFVELGDQTGVGITVSATKPSDQTLPWLQLDQYGKPIRIYWFAGGAWLSRHPLPPGATMWWFAVAPNFSTFDGGDGGAESDVSGPMWRLAKLPDGTEIAAKFPLVAGTLPSGTILAVGDQGGEEKHVLVQTELPSAWNSITSVLKAWRTNLETLAGQWLAPSAALGGGPTTPATETGTFTFANEGGDQGHNTMPPYAVGYLLQRTPLRQFYRIDA